MATDPYRYFRVEARELVGQLGQAMLDLEKGGGASELLPRLLRLAHTLKGAARVVRQPEIADDAHAIEDALAAFRDGGAGGPREHIDAVLGRLDRISERVATLDAPTASVPQAPAAPTEDAARSLRADVTEMDTLLNGIAETQQHVASLRRTVDVLDHGRHLVGLLVDRRPARRVAGDGRGPDETVSGPDPSIAHDLLALFGQLERNLVSGTDLIARELDQVRGEAERLRLVPARALFTLLERTARDGAQAQSKRVTFRASGGDVRLDAQVLGGIQSALVQVVRNAVAHGIETPAAREAAGKPAAGHITFDVSRRGRQVAFTCTDDGRGIDVAEIRRAAERKGLVARDPFAGGATAGSDEMGADELLRLLLKGGISTSRTITEMSGRGIGFDVVRDVTERLGGRVAVRTTPGRGTTVELIVPLSLASLPALMVEASGEIAAIPLDAVQRTIRVAASDIDRTARQQVVLDDGRIAPFMPLARALGAPVTTSRAARPWTAVLVNGAGAIAAIGVDRLVRVAHVVLRSLPDLSPASALMAGVSLDADGNPRFVLDPDGLVAESQRTSESAVDAPAIRRPVLVVDDSLTTRMLEQSILESAGYDVDLATSGEDALEQARRRDYALFLVDVEMPGMDGFTFIERTRRDETLRRVPAILVTSRAAADDRQRGHDVGAQGYIVKSEFDQTDLLERIRKLVG